MLDVATVTTPSLPFPSALPIDSGPVIVGVDARVTCFPRSRIRKQKRGMATVAENYASLVRRDAGERPQAALAEMLSASASSSEGNQWQNFGFALDHRLEWALFKADGTVSFGLNETPSATKTFGNSDIGGFFVKPHIVPLNCVINGNDPFARGAKHDYDTLECAHSLPPLKNGSVYGPASHWEVVVARNNVRAGLLSHRLQRPDTCSFKTKISRPANAGFVCDLEWTGIAVDAPQTVSASVVWGACLRVMFTQGEKPVFEMLRGQNWVTVRRLENAPINFFEDSPKTRLCVFLLGGKLIIGVDDHFHWLPFKQTNPFDQTDIRLIAASWVAAPLVFSSTGVMLVVGFSSLDFVWGYDTTIIPTKPATTRKTISSHTLERTVPIGVRGGLRPPSSPKAHDGFELQPVGHFPPGTLTRIETQIRQGSIKYTASLRGSATSSPFISGVVGHSPPEWNVGDGEGIDIRPAVRSIQIESAAPPLLSGVQATMEISRTLLEDLVDGLGVNLKTFVRRRNPIRIETRAQYSDGSESAWHCELEGYIWSDNKAISGVNAGTMTLVCFDEVMRLQAPAALINRRYPPLDWFLVRKCQRGEDRVLWGGEAVKEILRIAVGDEIAERLNGNGDPRRYYAKGHVPLLSAERDHIGISEITQVLGGQGVSTSGGFRCPPPFGSDALRWGQDIGKTDFAVFFSQGDGTMYYGRLDRFLAGKTPRIVPDNEYVRGDVNELLQEASVTSRPQSEWGTVEVWSNPPGSTMEGVLPAISMASATVPPGDELDPNETWETFKVINDPRLWFPSVAEATAQIQVALTAGVSRSLPTLSVRYSPATPWRWGDLAVPKLESPYSDRSIELNGQHFRVERVNTSLDLVECKYVSKLSVRPVLNTGL